MNCEFLELHKMKLTIWFLATCFVLWMPEADGLLAESAFVAEATEIIGVVRMGVSLVEYIFKGN